MQRPITFPEPNWLVTVALVLAILVPGGISAVLDEPDSPAASVGATSGSVTPVTSPAADNVVWEVVRSTAGPARHR